MERKIEMKIRKKYKYTGYHFKSFFTKNKNMRTAFSSQMPTTYVIYAIYDFFLFPVKSPSSTKTN